MSTQVLRKYFPSLILLLAAIIWGGGFMSVQIATDNGFLPGHIAVIRYPIAAFVMLAVANKKLFPLTKQELCYGATAGALMFTGGYIQNLGLRLTSPSNNGFFTVTYVIMVPFIAWILHRRRPPVKVFVCCFIALAGFFVLSYQPELGFSVNSGDLLTLLSALFFSCHVAALGFFVDKISPIKLAFLQIVFAGLFSLIPFFAYDIRFVSEINLIGGVLPLLYLGILSSCVAFFMQVWGQAKMSSGRAAVILSTEALWCAVFSVMLGFEPLTWQMALGGGIVVGSICLLEADIRLPIWLQKTPEPEPAGK